jgi:Zn-dependent M28 family amino/carboxypeptidase
MVKINTTSATKGEKINHNVIAEIPGNKDNSVIVIGAHLDSWDISEGAHDNGAGVVQVLEVLRVFKKLDIKNRHTLRFVLFANEENGVHGGETYAAAVKKSGEKHIFAIESDAGGYSPRGISLDMIPQRRRLVFAWKNFFLPYGVYDFTQETSGQDIAPLKKLGIPLAELVPDMQRYFDIHHTSQDTFDKVNRRELNLGAVAMAQIVYMIDQNW